MRLDNQLQRWREAELIDSETAERIREYEASQHRPLFLYAVSGIGALSLCLGLISIVASNWHSLSGGVKVGGDLILGASLCLYFERENSRLTPWVRELLIALIVGWTIASIALVGQVYQLSGDGKSAVTLWAALTSPLVLQGRSTFSGVLLLGMLSLTFGLWAIDLKSDHLALATPGLVLLIFAMSLYEPIYRRRVQIVSVFRVVSLVIIIAAAAISSFVFYAVNSPRPEKLSHLQEAFIYCLPGLAWLWRLLKGYPKSARVALITWMLCAFIPLIPRGEKFGFLAILFFMGYWFVIANASFDLSIVWLFRLATFAIAARLISVYFELVGSLLNTGMLFLTGGALILIVARYWYQKQAELITERQGQQKRLKDEEAEAEERGEADER